MSNWKDWTDTLPLCDRCGQRISGSHYHCGGCDSTDTTGQYGHHKSIHVVDGKIVNMGKLHHCTLHLPDGECELEK